MNTSTPTTIAVVDDHEMFREGMCSLLSVLGYEVTIKAANGRDFLTKLAAAEAIPDVCLLDIEMPEMNGMETANCIKTIWPGMKILGHGFDNDEFTGMMQSGADACLLKGGTLPELQHTLVSLLSA